MNLESLMNFFLTSASDAEDDISRASYARIVGLRRRSVASFLSRSRSAASMSGRNCRAKRYGETWPHPLQNLTVPYDWIARIYVNVRYDILPSFRVHAVPLSLHITLIPGNSFVVHSRLSV